MQNPKYIEIDNLYYSSLIIVNYYREQTDLLLKNLIETNINMNISIFYEKQDSYKVIKDLTYHIGNIGVEVKEANQNRQDIDIASYTYNDAKYIRKEMQVNNEDLYFLYIYINLFSEDIKELEYNLNKIEGILQSKGMQTRRANFRQEECFIAGLPIMENKKIISEVARRNILTSGLVSTYPFILSSLFDKNGIFIGTNIYNNSLIFIDRYNTEKYKNANICIFGTSGAGKSFYTKLLILRYKLLGIKQYIIDPDREYNEICEKLEGVQIKIGATSNTFINVLEIRKESIEDGDNGYLATKISKLIGFFNLIFGEMDEEEKALLEEKLIEVYKLKNITFDDKTLFNKNGKFKNEKQMPILGDLFNIFGKDERTKKFKIKLLPFVEGSMKFFNNYSNIKLENELIVADIYDLGEENIKYAMYILIDIFWDKVKQNRKEKKAIYMDEIWRLIGVTSNKYVASFIYKIFKTIRKYGGSGVAITQDISDIFSLDNGTYGKSILNNSSIKTFFALEEENIKILGEFANLSDKEKIEIKSLRRGECLMFVGEDHILTKIQASEEEKKIIEGEKYKKMINIITAINNPKINEKLKLEKNINIECKDIFYKEGIIEILEQKNYFLENNNFKNNYYIILENNLPGEIKTEDLINKILEKNKKIKIIILIKKENEINIKIKNKNIIKIKYNKKINIEEIKKNLRINNNFYKNNFKENEKIKNKKIYIKIDKNSKKYLNTNLNKKLNRIRKYKFLNFKNKEIKKENRIITFIGNKNSEKNKIILNLIFYLLNKNKKVLLFIQKDIKNNEQKNFYLLKEINKNIDIIFYNNLLKINYIKKLQKKYNYILIEINCNKNKILNKDIIKEVDKNLLIINSNIKEIKNIKNIIEENDLNKKNNMKIILNNYNRNSINKEIVENIFKENKIIGIIKKREEKICKII